MKRMIFGSLLTMVGLVYAAVCFHWALSNPWYYAGIDGLLGSFLAHDILLPFLFSSLTLLLGLAICCFEAYRRK